jgi:maltose-binding protein MalE
LRAHADAITKRDDAGNITVIGFRPTDAIGVVMAVWAALMGAEYFDAEAGKYTFTSPEMTDAANYILGFYEAYGPENMAAFATNYGGWTGSANSAFTRGVQGLIINGYWMPGELTKLAPPEFTFGYDWVPSRDNSKVQMIGGWSNVIPTGIADPAAVWDFIVAASSDEASQIALDTAGGFCASKSFLEGVDGSQYPGLEWFLKSGLEADEVVPEPNFPGLSVANDNWNAMLEEVAFGNQTLEAGLAELEEMTQNAYDEAVRQPS